MNIEGQTVGELELSDAVFAAPVNDALMYDMVLLYRANQRQGTSDTKTRGEVAGSTKKPWRQKGTGRARVGTKRSPVWRTGGITFGPHQRDYSYTIPKKSRRAALRSALSAKLRDGELIVLDTLSLNEPKTKLVADALMKLNAEKGALIVAADFDNNVYLSARNIPGTAATAARNINVYDVLKYDRVVMTKDAVAKVEEVLA
jgi:large subunit ribosomal protein L4